MNTTIIIVLGALILIVIIAIIVILIKGKSVDEDTSQESSPMTFQEEENTEQAVEPDMTPPQLHTSTNTPTPQPTTPAIDDLTTPQQAPSIQPDSTSLEPVEEERPSIEQSLNQPIQPIPQQQESIQQGPNPLPDSSQINEDLANLKSSSNLNSDMDNLADTVNVATQTENEQVAEVAPSVETTDEVTPTPAVEEGIDIQNQGYNPPPIQQASQQQAPVQPQEIPTIEDVQNQGYTPPQDNSVNP